MDNLKSVNNLNNNNRKCSLISKDKISPLQWQEIIIDYKGDKIYLCFHVAASIDNFIYIHGGLKEKNSLLPTNLFYRLNLNNLNVENLTTEDSPFLSQHACVTLINRYFVIIGGWDGHCRSNKVHVFDSEIKKWLKTPRVTGFPEKAGLSGHTANASLKTKGIFPEIVIIGREGSVKTQRRFGNGYRLCCNSDLSHFKYKELELSLDSRSYHCSNIINNKLFIVGGRDDKVIDIQQYKSLFPSIPCIEVSNILERLNEFNLRKCPPLTGRRKEARRGHCLIPGINGFVVFGGTTFFDTNQTTDYATFIFQDKPGFNSNYYFLGSLNSPRSYGAFTVNNNGHAYYHGGIGTDGDIRSEFMMLKLISE